MSAVSSSNDVIRVPGAPAIPGLSFRRFRGESDFKVIADVGQRSRDADLFDWFETPEDVADRFRHIQNCDLTKDLLFVEVNRTTVGFCRCEWNDRSDGVRTYDPVAILVPEWRGKGLRHMMLRENERRLREIAKEHSGEHKKFFEAMANYAENHWKSLLEEEGYRPFRHNIQMIRPNLDEIPDLSMPKGLEVRSVKPEHHQTIFKATGEAFRDEPNFAEMMWSEEGLNYMSEWRLLGQPEIWQVAWEGDEVAGGVLNFIDVEENKKLSRNWGYLAFIFVRRPYRNRGLASALIARSFEALKKKGVSQAALFVDSDSPTGARHLYERMGFRPTARYTRYRKPLDDQAIGESP